MFFFRKKKTKGKKGKKDSSSSGSGSDNDVEVIKVWNSRSRGGGEGNVDETGNNPSVSIKTDESKSNECCLYHGTLFRNMSLSCQYFFSVINHPVLLARGMSFLNW